MIIAFTRLDMNNDLLLREDNSSFIFEQRQDLHPIKTKSFDNYSEAEGYYEEICKSLSKEEEAE
jgi:hypothetical protein